MKMFTYGILTSWWAGSGVLGELIKTPVKTKEPHRLLSGGIAKMVDASTDPSKVGIGVWGQLFEYSEEDLKEADRVESNGFLYQRKPLVVVDQDGEEHDAQGYFYLRDTSFASASPVVQGEIKGSSVSASLWSGHFNNAKYTGEN